MALDPSFIGYSYPATPPYLVGREKIREFATAIGADDAIHFDPAAAQALGYPDVIAPATFPIAVTESLIKTLADDPKLGLDFDRVVHGDQRYTYQRPVHAGDNLTCVLTIADITERAGAGFLSTRIDITTVDGGELVATAFTRLVVRAPAGDEK
jgi:acyl dehydratase